MQFLKKYINFINESKKENFIDWYPYSKDIPPKTDLDIHNNRKMIKYAVQTFDKMFGTQYFDKFGMDYHYLVGSNKYFGKEVISALVDEALKPEIYSQFKLDNSVSDTLYDYLMYLNINADDDTDVNISKVVKFINNKIPKKIFKGELGYKFFDKFGEEFTNEMVEEIIDVNYNIPKGEKYKHITPSLQREFLNAFNRVMKRYIIKNTKTKKTMIDTEEFFTLVLEDYLKSEYINTDRIKEVYVKKKINDWLRDIKKECSKL